MYQRSVSRRMNARPWTFAFIHEGDRDAESTLKHRERTAAVSCKRRGFPPGGGPARSASWSRTRGAGRAGRDSAQRGGEGYRDDSAAKLYLRMLRRHLRLLEDVHEMLHLSEGN